MKVNDKYKKENKIVLHLYKSKERLTNNKLALMKTD